MSKVNKTIQQKMSELSEQVAWFEGDDFILEEAIERFKKAEILAKDIDNDFASLRNEITVIKARFDEEL